MGQLLLVAFWATPAKRRRALARLGGNHPASARVKDEAAGGEFLACEAAASGMVWADAVGVEGAKGAEVETAAAALVHIGLTPSMSRAFSGFAGDGLRIGRSPDRLR